MNFKQIKAIERANKERILKVCPDVDEQSGIYIFTRPVTYSYGSYRTDKWQDNKNFTKNY
jgi:hypothetical protein